MAEKSNLEPILAFMPGMIKVGSNCFLVAIFIAAFSLCAQAQTLESIETDLLALETQLGETPSDVKRSAASDQIKAKLLKAFKKEDCFDYPFDQLLRIATLKSSDNFFRFFNWQIPQMDGSSRYECLILLSGGKSHTELIDSQTPSDKLIGKTLMPDSWYGCLYYDIQVTESKQGKTYTLLGWDAADELITRKVIDALVFGKGNQVELGAPIFELNDKKVFRRVFTYSEEVVMTLRYIAPKKAIVFDHLTPVQSRLDGNYAFYGPSDSFDAYQWNASTGAWVLFENFDMARPKSYDEKPQFNFPSRPDLSRSRDTINPLIGK